SVRTKPTPAQVEAAERCYARLRQQRPLPWWQRLPRPGLALQLGLGTGLVLAVVLGTSRLLLPTLPWQWLLELVAAGGLSALLVSVLLRPLEQLRVRAQSIADNPLSQQLYTGKAGAVGQIEFALLMLEAQIGAVV